MVTKVMIAIAVFALLPLAEINPVRQVVAGATPGSFAYKLGLSLLCY